VSDIQRWDYDEYGSMFEADDGPLCFYADHVAAVENTIIPNAWNAGWQEGFVKGQRQGERDGRAWALADAVAAVEALPIDEFVRLDPADAKATVIASIKGVGNAV